MMLTVLRPAPSSRFARPRELPRLQPPARLHVTPARHRLTAPPMVRPPPAPSRRRRRASAEPLQKPPPVLRLVTPAPEVTPRFTITRAAPPAPPGPALMGYAKTVGIAGTGGTMVVQMTPADLTQPGLVNITNFRVALFAGVW